MMPHRLAAICRLNILILYNAWPDQKGQETWEQRFLWLGRYVCCQCGEATPTGSYSLNKGARKVLMILVAEDNRTLRSTDYIVNEVAHDALAG